MRSLRTILAAAFLLLLFYLFLSVLVDGYFGGNIFPDDLEPDSWSAPNSWSEWRDITIVFVGLFMALAALILCALLGALVYLVFTIRRLMTDNVAPAIDSAKGALDNIRGTAEFTGETVVSPIIRVYSVVRGVRSGFGALGGLGERVKRNRDRQKRKGRRE